MKYLWILGSLLFMESAHAQVLTVTNIKVSVTADSSATAREEALDKAHDLAFQKLVSENFPEKSGALPTHQDIINMVTDFSIEREKTTPTNYTASLTFQFDASKVQTWAQRDAQHVNAPLSPSLDAGKPLKITAFYTTLSDWNNIKNTLENSSGVQKITLHTFSSQQADMDVTFSGNIETLKAQLVQRGWSLSPQEQGWRLSANK